MNTIVAEERVDVEYDAKVTPLQRALRKLCQAVNVLVHSSLYADEEKLAFVFACSDELFDLLSPLGEDGQRMLPERHPELAGLQKVLHTEMIKFQALINAHKETCSERKEPTDPVLTTLECRLRLVDSSLWI